MPAVRPHVLIIGDISLVFQGSPPDAEVVQPTAGRQALGAARAVESVVVKQRSDEARIQAVIAIKGGPVYMPATIGIDQTDLLLGTNSKETNKRQGVATRGSANGVSMSIHPRNKEEDGNNLGPRSLHGEVGQAKYHTPMTAKDNFKD